MDEDNKKNTKFSFKEEDSFQKMMDKQKEPINNMTIPSIKQIKDKNIQISSDYFNQLEDSPRFGVSISKTEPILNKGNYNKSKSKSKEKHDDCHLIDHEGGRKSHFEYLKKLKEEKNIETKVNPLTEYTKEEIKQHTSHNDIWVILHGKVYNITNYIDYHPGGLSILIENGGEDITDLFQDNHPWVNIKNLIGKYQIGILKN